MDWLACLAAEVRENPGWTELEPADPQELLAELPDVEVERCEGDDTGLLVAGRRALIVIGQRWRGVEYVERLWHELAHWLLLRRGCGNPLPAGNHRRLRRLWDDREEADCRRLVRLLRLPWALCQQVPDDGELAELTGCPLSMIQERRAELAR